jgi:3,4-dihydroxy 2-butanone 4-phosphate synthase/GTP cyclohydrolase II
MAAMDAGRATSDRLRAGGVVLVIDDATDPPQASLVCSAARVTPAAVNFLATHGRGLVSLTLTRERMRQLGIPLMTSDLSRGPVFQGASIEARQGVSTISAADRATTVRAVARDATPADRHARPRDADSAHAGGALVRARRRPQAISFGSRASASRRPLRGARDSDLRAGSSRRSP